MTYKGKTIISIIPCRGGSKGVPRKNIRRVGVYPLVSYSVRASVSSKYVDRTIACTEDKEIAKVCKKWGAEYIEEPEKLAADDVRQEPVMVYVLGRLKTLENFVPDYVVLLEPTGLFTMPSDIDNAIKNIVDNDGDSLLSVYENDVFFWNKEAEPLNYDYRNRPLRQDKEWEFVENSNIYITRIELLLKTKCRLGGKILLYVMPKEICCEIDTEFDLEMANWMVKSGYGGNNH